jgi:hypothetical protein
MARTIAEGLDSFGTAIQERRKLAQDQRNQNFDRALKLGELQSKGINITEQQTPRKLFGFIPAGTQRSLSMNYDPTMNPSYAKDQSVIDKNKAQTKQALAKARSFGNGPSLTPGQQLAKDSATREIYQTVESNKPRREAAEKAKESVKNIPQGLIGKAKVQMMKMFDPNNATLSDWQNVKSALTEAQLAYTNNTKGAISDREMQMFGQAVANDDLASVARMAPQIDKLVRFMDANEAGQMGAYQRNYGENPRSWFPGNGGGGQNFNSPEEADASGLAPGTRVTVQGRPYEI